MSDRPLAVITTRLPPAICGVGAYSALLRQHWPGNDRPVEFLVMDGAREAHAVCAGDRVTQFDGKGAKLKAALERLGESDVILHYVGRAYARWAGPVWLPRALARWRRKFPRGRLLVFVHEVPGAAAFTSRHFWLGKVDEWILRRLTVSADIVVTNTESQQRRLARISGRADVHLAPVGSNIELVPAATAARRRDEFVVFGLPFGRGQTLRQFDSFLRQWRERGELAKLHLIGPEDDRFSSAANRLAAAWPGETTLVHHGALSAPEVSRLLQSAQFVLTNVSAETWSKSGAFMACAVHGCAPVVAGRPGAQVPFSCAVAADEVATISDAELERRAAALRAWYAAHADWPEIASRLAALLDGVRR